MKNVFVFTILLLISSAIFAQDAVYQKFYYQNGTLSSEGFMREGKPDGYWISYYPEGGVRSKGNRKNFQLDSLWIFYDKSGLILSEITYKNGKKHGLCREYEEDFVKELIYKEDTIVGVEKHIDNNGYIIGLIPYQDGVPQGIARFFDTLANIHTILYYDYGNIIKREYINRWNANQKKQGAWKIFNENGFLVQEGYYINGKKNGYFKYYDEKGNFQYIEKYENDILVDDAVETKKLDRKVDYHPTGQIRTVAHFFKGKPEGVRREYDTNGNVVKSYIFHEGIKLGEGVVDDNGKKQGLWKEFYESGALKAKGKYLNGRPIGDWTYFYETGQTEIIGAYTKKGKKDGQWWWYYPDESVLAFENYEDGDLDGYCFTIAINGDTLTKGTYSMGVETGKWYYLNDSVLIVGKYIDGNKEGIWKTYYPNGKIKIEERYFNDLLDGKVIYYWPNAIKMAEYNYNSGLLNGNVVKYDENGSILFTTTYKMGVEIKYDGIKVTPTIDISFE